MKINARFHSRALFSLITSTVILIVVYFFDNLPFPFRESSSFLTAFESTFHRVAPGFQEDIDEGVFINTGYDAALVNTRHGKEKITDRSTLLRLLQDLERYDNYKEIFIDIRFEKQLTTDFDSSLVQQVMNMRNLFVAKHWDYDKNKDLPLIDERLLNKAAYADYSSTVFNTAFTRYEFVQHSGASVALQLYNDIEGRTIKPHGKGFFTIYSDNGCLAVNSSFIRFPEDFSSANRNRDDGSFRYRNLGEDIYGWMSNDSTIVDQFFKDCEGKIIIIGDYVFDRHDTYINKQPGPYLNYLAYRSLHRGKHLISWPFVAFLLVLYFSIVLAISYQFTLVKGLKYLYRKMKIRAFGLSKNNQVLKRMKGLILFVASLFGYSLFLSLLSYCSIVWLDKSISIFIPTLCFTLVDSWFRFKSYEE